MTAPPFLPLFVDEFLDATKGFSLADIGAYTLLQIHLWQHGGSVPNDPKALMKAMRLPPNQHQRARGAALLASTPCSEAGFLYSPRLVEAFGKSQKNKQSRTLAASKAAKARWGKRRGTIRETMRDASNMTASRNAKIRENINTLSGYDRARFLDSRLEPLPETWVATTDPRYARLVGTYRQAFGTLPTVDADGGSLFPEEWMTLIDEARGS